jgi:hypothetical protein
MVLKAVALAFGLVQLASPALAQTESKSTDRTAPPRLVTIGVYVNQINGMSLKDEKVQLDFHIWFRWKGDDLKPLETFDLTNGDIDQKEDVYQTKIGDTNYAVCRCLATIQKLWDVRNFPQDNHDITIEIEDENSEDFKLRYMADLQNCNLSPEARVAGWDLSAGDAQVIKHRTNTNFGDISLPSGHASDWSRFVYTVHMTRPGYGFFGKLFTGLFIAVGISTVGLLIPAHELDSRFALSVGAMFAAVASEYVVTGSLPDSNVLTMADKLHIMSFLCIFITLVEATATHKLAATGHEHTAWWVDRVALIVIVGGYIALVIGMVVFKL